MGHIDMCSYISENVCLLSKMFKKINKEINKKSLYLCHLTDLKETYLKELVSFSSDV